MPKVVLLLFFLLLNACSMDNPSLPGEINKVTVVKYTPYMKHRRAYFTRTDLNIIKENKKYLYLYHAKKNDLGILFYRKNQYILYSLSRPDQPALAITVSPKTSTTYVLKRFKRKGYKTITSLSSIGFDVSVSPRIYKGKKTFLVEIREYSHLQSLYKRAIKNYHADPIKNIQTTLPKQFIYAYYKQYEKRAKTQAQSAQLRIIAQKLQIKTKTIPTKAEEPKQAEQDPAQYTPIQKTDFSSHPAEIPYSYYLKYASLDELLTYISQSATKNTLSYRQYTMLKHRKDVLTEEKLFKEGSLEELIAAYKVNKDPKYKKRIMTLMKDTQEHQK